ncbi:MAG: hypothetical protein DMD80_16620 [Candidatus Rokuibacteriota bacterium]|nr:MAG: hypothetical protein DMD80_16620 [Candidatus Rokubacteria bacterium]
MGDPLRVAHALDQRRADADRALRLVRLEDRRVMVGAAGVEVDRMEVDELGEPAQGDLVPLAPAVLATADELDGRIGALHDHGERARLLHVVVGVHVADLPAAVHLVAQPPVAHAVRVGVAVLPTKIRPRGVARAVAVLDPRLGLVHRARAHVHADERLGAEHAAILDELVGAEAIRLLGVPRQLAAPRSLVSRPDAVEPVVAAHEVAAGPAEDRDAQGSRGIEHVAPEAAGVGERGTLVVHAAVDAAPQVLDELAEDPAVDGAQAPREIDRDASHDPRSLGNAPARVNATRPVIESRRDASVAGGHAMAQRPVSRRTFLAGAAAAATATAWPRPGAAQSKATITYWNGLTGADGKVMDELIERFTRETGIRVEQQRLPWADLYPKLQVSVPAGEGPDLALIHTVEVPHFANDGVLEAIDEATATGKGFRGDGYLPATWQGGTFQGKRYSLPLDVPQHLLYLNVKVMKEAGLVGADGKPKVPAGRDELVTMAKKIARGDTFGFAIGTSNPGRYTWGFHNLLWQNGANIYTPDLKRAGVSEPAALEVAEFWAGLGGPLGIAPPANANCRDAFIAGRLGMWIAGSWNFTGLREAKVDFAAAPVPRLFKQPVVWSMPHQYAFPKPKSADRNRREAAWTHVRWLTDHVAEWTLKAGQVSASRKAHGDPRVTGDPVLKTLLGQAPNWQVGQPTPKWVAAENLTRPVIESIYTGQKPAKAAMEDLARQINALPD